VTNKLAVLGALVLTGCTHTSSPEADCGAWLLPKGWTQAGPCEAVAPEGTLRARIFRSSVTDDARAIDDAWKSWRSAQTLTATAPLLHPPPSGGFTSQGFTRFSSSTGAVVHAEVRRAGEQTWVVLAEGDEASHARREAQLEALIDSVGGSAVKPETFAGRKPVTTFDAAALGRFLDDARTRLGVPGAAMAIVSKDKVLFERASGVKRLGGNDAFGVHTRTLVGSVTKPMTTLMQASLVDRGLVQWDQRVIALYPPFALGDPELTQKLKLWHMSCACTGMPRRDLEHLFEFANVTPEQRLAQMGTMKPTTGLGEAFQYSNLMVAAGGFIAAHAFAPRATLGDAYRQAMQTTLFDRIGMADARLDFAEATKGDVATPHALDIDGTVQVLPLGIEGNVVPIAPAGAVWASLVDLERYAQTELGQGMAANGEQIATRESWGERVIPRVQGATYGLGIDVDEVAGLKLLGHDGGSMGFGTSVYLLPDLGLGLVVVTNARHGSGAMQLPLNDALKRRFLEALFPGARDVSSVMVQYALDVRKLASAEGKDVERTPDAAWLKKFAGTWKHPTLGTVIIKDTLFDAGEWQGHFGRRGDWLVMVDPPFAGTPFALKEDAQGPALVVPDPQQPELFRRVNP